MITVELEHFSLDKICDSGQCFRMKKLGDGHFSMVAGDQYLEMRQKGGVVDFYCSQEEFICYWVLYFDLDTDYETYMNAANPRDKYGCRHKGRRRDPDLKTGSLGNDRHVSDFPAE